MSWQHVAALVAFGGAGALACYSIAHDIRRHWPAIVQALRQSR